MFNVPMPTYMGFKEWASKIQLDNPGLVLSVPPDKEHWWEWASFLSQNQNLGNFPTPSKIVYPEEDHWRVWAAHFIDGLPKN